MSSEYGLKNRSDRDEKVSFYKIVKRKFMDNYAINNPEQDNEGIESLDEAGIPGIPGRRCPAI
jgi:hypothetical protein